MEEDKEIIVCGLAADGQEAYEVCLRKKPDVVLMDMRMPKRTGDEVTQHIKKELPQTRVLAYTVFDARASVSAACFSGADGYILKDVCGEELISAIKSTAAGGVCHVSARVFDMMKANAFPTAHPKDLTEKEKRILSLLGQTKNNKEIAEELHCAPGSIKNDISRLLRKFDFRDRVELAVYAVKNGLDA